MSKDLKYITEHEFQEWMANLYEATESNLEGIHGRFSKRFEKLEDRIVVLEALTRGMRLPDELDIAGQTYVKKNSP